MSVIVKIIKAEATAEKNATKRLVENHADILMEAAAIADIRAAYRGKDFAAAMKAQGYGNLGERDQRNSLAAVLWIASDEGTKAFHDWAMDDGRANCSTLRGIKKAATPTATRAARPSEGGEGEEAEAVDTADKAPRTAADILKNAFDQCRAAGISPEQFLEFVISAEGAKVADKAIDKAAA
jgi:hypothetical protein